MKQLKEIEKQEQTKHKINVKKVIIKIRTKIETKNYERSINLIFENINL